MTKKLYLDNPYLRQTTAKILDKNEENGNYSIKLDRTIFFPHLSGGQTRDFGYINGNHVTDVYEDDLEIIHVLEEDIEGETVELNINWENRFDLMQQHTGQHILSAAFQDLFDIKTIGFHIGNDYVTIDLEFSDLKTENISQAENLANKIIQSNFKVASKLLQRENLDSNYNIDISKIPEDDKNIRIVNIEGIDISPCNGTHVSSTGEIGLLKVVNISNYKGNTRLTFLCGGRALRDYTLKDKSIKEIALSLSTGVDDLLDKFLHFKEEKEAQAQKIKDLKNELVFIKAESIFDKRQDIDGINYIKEDLSSLSKEELKNINSYLNEKENLIQIYKSKSGSGSSFLISRTEDLEIDLKEIFDLTSEEIIIKGGGSKNQIQGITSPSIIDKVIEKIYEKIKNHYKN